MRILAPLSTPTVWTLPMCRAAVAFLVVLASLAFSGLSAPRASAQDTSPRASGAAVPTPESVLGHRPGADRVLAGWDRMQEYFQALAEASDRVVEVPVGTTAEGRAWSMYLISAPENLRQVDQLRVAWRALAEAAVSPDSAERISRNVPALIHIDGGMHSTEAANAQHTMQLAYELASSQDRRALSVLDKVVLTLWPTLNPDGLQMVADWYNGNVGTPYEVAALPRLYQKYVGHDNNRDAYMLNTVESRVITRTWRQWEPQIIHTHHQSSPFPTRIWLPPFAEPIAPRAPALPSRTVNLLGMAMARALEAEGLRGATHMDVFDAWYPGYSDYLPIFQNIAAYWTETALYRYATPRFYAANDFPDARRAMRAEALYVSPWEGGWWRIGDAVEYMRVVSWAVLDHAARQSDDVLLDRYRAGRAQVERYREHPPFAYVVPRLQRDPVAAAELVRRLAFNGIRVLESAEGEGSWIIPMDQPFAELVRQLFDLQEYPDLRDYPEGPPSQPYDFAGWTLPVQMGVRVRPLMAPISAEERASWIPVGGDSVNWLDSPSAPGASGMAAPVDGFANGQHGGRPPRLDVTPWDTPRDEGFDTNPVAAGVEALPGSISGSGAAVLADPRQNNAFRMVNRALDDGARVRFGGGSYRISDWSGNAARETARQLRVQARRGSAAGEPVRLMRLGLYRPWQPSMDEGWTRWMLERFEFPLTGLTNADLRAGDLRARYDVIVLPSESPSSLRNGFMPGTVPARYAGGMGDAGVRALRRFVRDGGTLICLNRSSDLAIEAFNLPVSNVVADLPRDSFFVSGSLVEVVADTTHPVMAGMPGRARVVFDRSPVFEVADDFRGHVLARYSEHGSPLVSGYLLGESHMQGKAAALDVRHGEGRVILFGFRPQWRGQPFGTFRTLMNAILAPPHPLPGAGGPSENPLTSPLRRPRDRRSEGPEHR